MIDGSTLEVARFKDVVYLLNWKPYCKVISELFSLSHKKNCKIVSKITEKVKGFFSKGRLL